MSVSEWCWFPKKSAKPIQLFKAIENSIVYFNEQENSVFEIIANFWISYKDEQKPRQNSPKL